MNKHPSTGELGGLMVVVFCITFWIVAGQAPWQAYGTFKPAGYDWRPSKQAKQAYEQALQALQQAEQASKQAKQAYDWIPSKQAKQAYEQAEQAYEQAEQAVIDADADAPLRKQRLRGVDAGLLAAVLLLVGALAWSKLTAKA